MYLPVILLFYTFLESKVDKVHRVVLCLPCGSTEIMLLFADEYHAIQHTYVRIGLKMGMGRLTRNETTAEPVSRDQILRRERGQGKNV